MEVVVISEENIKPSSPTPHHLRTYQLSILDQLRPTPYAQIILYYHDKLDANNVIQALERSVALKKSLSKTLTQFYPLAGVVNNHLSIDCNDIGAKYILATVHRRLDEFLGRPDLPLINSLLPFDPAGFDESSGGNRALSIQVTIFACGGMTIGLCGSHRILDGSALFTFLKGWAHMTHGAEEVVVYPNLALPSLFPAKSLWLTEMMMNDLFPFFFKEGNFSTKRFVFSSDALAILKTETARNGVQRPTRVAVVSALIWKCAMSAAREAYGFQKPSLLNHAINLRKKVPDTVSKDTIGNMLWMSNAVCPASYDSTLHGLVNKVQESIQEIHGEFVKKVQGDNGYVEMQRSVQEMMEIVSKEPLDPYLFSSWCNMGFYEIDFGWGNPIWLNNYVVDSVPTYVNLVNLVDTPCGKGIEAWLSLDEAQMKILQQNPELLKYASLYPSPLPTDQ